MALRLLSYPQRLGDPGWPGNPTLSFEAWSSIAKGDPANTFNITIFGHQGSHMDGPKHFNDNGPTLRELPLEYFHYTRPLLLDIPKSYEEMVLEEELRPHAEAIAKADLLMLRSGFSRYRHQDPQGYAARGPAVSSQAARYLMDHFPNLRGLALDWISLACHARMEDGILSHQYILGKFHPGQHRVIIEDLDFSQVEPGRLREVWAVPLLIEGVDSAPCTVLAVEEG